MGVAGELADAVMTWGVRVLLVSAVVFGFVPTFMANAMARIYPEGHPRRVGLVSELRDVPRRAQLIWVFEQLATVLFDGVPARFSAVAAKRRRAKAMRRLHELLPRSWVWSGRDPVVVIGPPSTGKTDFLLNLPGSGGPDSSRPGS